MKLKWEVKTKGEESLERQRTMEEVSQPDKQRDAQALIFHIHFDF